MSTDPEDLRRQADAIEARAHEEASRLISSAAERAGQLRRAADVIEGLAWALSERPDNATIAAMAQVQNVAVTPKKYRGQPLRSKGPIAQAARNAGLSVSLLSEEIGESYANMRSWDRRNSVPTRVQQKLSKARYQPPAKPKKS